MKRAIKFAILGILCILTQEVAWSQKTYYQYDRSKNYQGKYTVQEKGKVKTTKYYDKHNTLTRVVVEDNKVKTIYDKHGKVLSKTYKK